MSFSCIAAVVWAGVGFLMLSLWHFLGSAVALSNGLGQTPAMGWNSWNLYGCDVNEDIVRKMADSIVDSGLQDLGYEYVTVDDCWQTGRGMDGKIQIDNDRFPSGMKALGDYIHSKGLKFGIYSSAGVQTCMGRAGSLYYEQEDANTYAEWGVDFLKYDNCWPEFGISRKSNIERFSKMRDALNNTGRPIYYSMCNWGQAGTWEWYQKILEYFRASDIANSWRTTGDIGDLFTGWSSNCPCTDKNCWMVDYLGMGINTCSVTNILDKNVDITQYSQPGGFNDLDMLEVGNGGMSTTEYQSHFTLWAAFKSPLILGNDLSNMSPEISSIIKNKEIIAINQDHLGLSVSLDEQILDDNGKKMIEIYIGPLINDQEVLVIFNRADEDLEVELPKHYANSNLKGITVRNLWTFENATLNDVFPATCESHGVLAFRVF